MVAQLCPLRRSSAVVAVAALGVAATLAQSRLPSESELVPTAVAGAARNDLVLFAETLAKARIPAGFIIGWPREPVANPKLRAGTSVTGRVTLGSVLRHFEEAHPEYTATRSPEALSIRARYATACESAARTNVAAGHVVLQGSVSSVLEEILVRARPAGRGELPSGGKAGSVLARPGEAGTLPAEPFVLLELRSSSLEEALDIAVGRATGTVWLLEEGRDLDGTRSCRLRLFREDGTSLSFGRNLAR